eukprot:PITA_36591
MLKAEIKRWNTNTFGHILKEKELIIQEIKQTQQKIISEGRSEELAQKEQDMESKLLEREKQEEVLWRQKSRIRWLKEGEKNTKFFHKSTVQRRMRNQISQIINAQGEKVETQEEIELEFIQHFKEMSKEPNINRAAAIEDITKHIPRLITEEQNTLLLKPISLQEVETTSNSLKAGLNATFIALIPKSEESNKPDKYRPIALCNIIYKIVSKVVELRLKPVLPHIISPEQSGYVEGRQITDGIILTHEIIHSLKQSRKPGMLLKIDLSKAFDSISWDYMQKVLNAFGFDNAWIRWVSSLISSAFFSILINGIPTSTFRASRGIRQGDPLSPFLFIIMAEGLGRSIKNSIQSQVLKGISLHQTPTISHQQFVDDNMIFGYSSVQEARALNSLLLLFSKASGALINSVKSQIFFFNTHPTTQRAIARILGFPIASLPSKYLGAPLFAYTRKHSSWTSLLENLEAKLSLWTHRSLNMASRMVLIKVLLQSMPLYLFSILAAPKWLLKAIKKLQRNFLWGCSGPNRKWALVKWEKASLPKIGGGIGLRDPEHNNKIMGTKIWWKWLTYPDTQWAQIWTAKYANNLPLVERVRMTEISKDSWQQLPSINNILQDIPNQNLLQQETINQFWTTNNTFDHREWKEASAILPHGPEEVQIALAAELNKRKIIKEDGPDSLRWGYAEKGTFTSTEAYHIIIKGKYIKDKIWERIWQPPIWPKISTFLWLLSHNRTLTWDNLRKRKFAGPSICLNCKTEEESTAHLMHLCPLSRRIWEKVSFRCQKNVRIQGDINNTLRSWPQQPYQCNILNSLWQIIPGTVMWNIWKERNWRVFKDQALDLEQVWTIIKQNLQETLSIKGWSHEDLPSNNQEQAIWNNWQFQITSLKSAQGTSVTKRKKTLTNWTHPPNNTYLLNFDGASKGNPGITGYGGVIRNSQGIPLKVYFGSIGWNTNNAAELEGLWQGLQIAHHQNFFPLIAEGDSQIIINMASKIQQGSAAQKVSRSWRMATRLESLQTWLQNNKAISFKHTRREGNKAADFLDNLGAEHGKEPQEGTPQVIVSESERATFQEILNSDMQIAAKNYPDAGDTLSDTSHVTVTRRLRDEGTCD